LHGTATMFPMGKATGHSVQAKFCKEQLGCLCSENKKHCSRVQLIAAFAISRKTPITSLKVRLHSSVMLSRCQKQIHKCITAECWAQCLDLNPNKQQRQQAAQPTLTLEASGSRGSRCSAMCWFTCSRLQYVGHEMRRFTEMIGPLAAGALGGSACLSPWPAAKQKSCDCSMKCM